MTDTITLEELAELLRCSRGQIYRLIHGERIPAALPKFGKSQAWKRSEIVAWMEAGCPVREQWEAMRDADGNRKAGRPGRRTGR